MFDIILSNSSSRSFSQCSFINAIKTKLWPLLWSRLMLIGSAGRSCWTFGGGGGVFSISSKSLVDPLLDSRLKDLRDLKTKKKSRNKASVNSTWVKKSESCKLFYSPKHNKLTYLGINFWILLKMFHQFYFDLKNEDPALFFGSGGDWDLSTDLGSIQVGVSDRRSGEGSSKNDEEMVGGEMEPPE